MHSGLVTCRTLWHTEHSTQRADPYNNIPDKDIVPKTERAPRYEVRSLKIADASHEDPTIVKRRKLQLYGHVSRSSGLAKTSLQGTVNGGRRQGRQRKRWEDNFREWTGLEFAKSQRAVENREK